MLTAIEPALAAGIVELTANAVYILNLRYLQRDELGNPVETPDDMFRRVARTVASAELIYDPEADVSVWENRFYRLMTNLEFLPNSPTLLNAGRGTGQLSACFVLPVGDSKDASSRLAKDAVLVHKSGGGTGFSLSSLKPEGHGSNCGPVSLIRILSGVTNTVKQGGIRRGCNNAVLNVDHPDIMEFIMAKDDPEVLTNFYTSVGVTDEFMQAVRKDNLYQLKDPSTREAVGQLNAKNVFDRIVAQTWKTGDPGMMFLSRIDRDNPTPRLGRLESVGGCGEQMLLPWESCNLGSINLARMVINYGSRPEVDYPRLESVVNLAVRFLDDVIDVNRFPLPQIEEITKRTRKIGLGVMGFADMLLQLGVAYDSDEGLEIAENVMRFINQKSHEVSAGLAVDRGVFPAFNGSTFDTPGNYRRRNASCTTIAPTGTLSLIAGCSSGIEPGYAMVYARNIMEGDCLLEVNPYFKKIAIDEGFYSGELLKRLAGGCSVRSMAEVPEKYRRLFITAPEIKPEGHVRMQAAFQKYTDSAVSKTVNLPCDAAKKDIANIYMMAYNAGLKGITAYRDGSRRLQPLSTGQAASDLVSTRMDGDLQPVYAASTMEDELI